MCSADYILKCIVFEKVMWYELRNSFKDSRKNICFQVPVIGHENLNTAATARL